jgi:hypothetical protein
VFREGNCLIGRKDLSKLQVNGEIVARTAIRVVLLLVLCLTLYGYAFAAAPSITSLSPTSGSVGASVTISGSNFGSTQGSSTIKFNGTVATPASWSATKIIAPVPSAATTGNVVVTVGGGRQ